MNLWHELVVRVSGTGAPSVFELWPALAMGVLVVAWPTARRWGRALVTIVHEAGHGFVGILVGRRFEGFVVSRELGGHAITAGKTRGPGRVLTTWAGYPAPALLGAVTVAVAMRGWSGALLILAAVAFVVLLLMSRSLRTAVLVVCAIIATGALWWWGWHWRDGVLVGVGLALLVGAWDSLRDVASSRDAGQDHRTLAQLTVLPAWFWLVTWFLVDAAASAVAVKALLAAF
ncbi:M50 family metallopeptidase [Actinomyces oricola]|mgnify:CR=1 FL=1|uniref:M50 family metallopeptidase n=1 Tax=Actinomyces oricola TaxID=206043 RepID=UPI000FFE6EA6|nr:M50 family metallopeptidase [Actinomyces oricola]